MHDDDELKAQCFGGDYMGEVYDNNLKRMQLRRQKRWWNAYMLFYTRTDQLVQPPTTATTTATTAEAAAAASSADDATAATASVDDVDARISPSSTACALAQRHAEQLSLAESRFMCLQMPPPIERSVRTQNLRFLHSRNLFAAEFFNFVRKLVEYRGPSPSAIADKLVSGWLHGFQYVGIGFVIRICDTVATVRGVVVAGRPVGVTILVPLWFPHEEDATWSGH